MGCAFHFLVHLVADASLNKIRARERERERERERDSCVLLCLQSQRVPCDNVC